MRYSKISSMAAGKLVGKARQTLQLEVLPRLHFMQRIIMFLKTPAKRNTKPNLWAFRVLTWIQGEVLLLHLYKLRLNQRWVSWVLKLRQMRVVRIGRLQLEVSKVLEACSQLRQVFKLQLLRLLLNLEYLVLKQLPMRQLPLHLLDLRELRFKYPFPLPQQELFLAFTQRISVPMLVLMQWKLPLDHLQRVQG